MFPSKKEEYHLAYQVFSKFLKLVEIAAVWDETTGQGIIISCFFKIPVNAINNSLGMENKE